MAAGASIILLASLLLSPLGPAAPAEEDPITQLCLRFSGHDQNKDKVIEIRALEPLAREGDGGRLVLILVEKHILDPLDNALDLTPLLARLAGDLGDEGYRAHVIAVELGSSEAHQDGCFILALREFFRAVAEEDDLAGVLLVGHFPDAILVRTCNWRRKGPVTLRKGQESEKKYGKVPILRRVPEDVAHRADIVLSDLDGRWEDIYVQPRMH